MSNIIKVAYPKVTFQYLNALFNLTNLNAPTEAPNLYLPVPGNPEFLETPSMSETIEFKQSMQIMKGEDLSADQAIGLQARIKLRSDPRVESHARKVSYLEGAAASKK